jgi:cytochrome c biogenesis protein ResB
MRHDVKAAVRPLREHGIALQRPGGLQVRRARFYSTGYGSNGTETVFWRRRVSAQTAKEFVEWQLKRTAGRNVEFILEHCHLIDEIELDLKAVEHKRFQLELRARLMFTNRIEDEFVNIRRKFTPHETFEQKLHGALLSQWRRRIKAASHPYPDYGCWYPSLLTPMTRPTSSSTS